MGYKLFDRIPLFKIESRNMNLIQETLTGFKWMANLAYDIEKNKEEQKNKKKVILAFEESIGYMCGTQVLDKDGVSGAIRAAELIAYLDQMNKTLLDKLHDLYRR